MDKNRVMAFTDAIIAIAATIMVLEMKVPEAGFTIAALFSQWPVFASYAVIYVGIVFLWTCSFQFLDASITRSNPSAQKDEVMYPVARAILFGGFALAFLSVAIHPSASLVVLAISNAVMIIHILREKRRYV